MVEGHWNRHDQLYELGSRDRHVGVDTQMKGVVDQIGVPVICFSMPDLILDPRV